MKTSLKHQERLEKIPAAAGLGFYQIDQKQAKDFRFYWADKEGQAVLLSKAYKTAVSRDKAQQETQQGTYQLAQAESEGIYYFTVETKGKRTIAISTRFADEASRNLALAKMKQYVSDTNTQQDQDQKPAASPTTPPAQRHRFQLVFYSQDGPTAWRGVLSHPLSQEKVKLHGVDTSRIAAFIEKHLEPDSTMAPAPPTLSSQKIKIQVAGADQHIPIPLRESLPLRISMSEVPTQQQDLRLQVEAKSLQNGQRIRLLDINFSLQTDQALDLKVPTQPLQAGLYRFTAKIFGAKRNDLPLTGDQLVWLTASRLALRA